MSSWIILINLSILNYLKVSRTPNSLLILIALKMNIFILLKVNQREFTLSLLLYLTLESIIIKK